MVYRGFLALWLIFTALLSGCGSTNSFSTYYGWSGSSPAPRKDAPSPQVVETLDLQARVEWFESNGYVVVGESSFEGAWESRAKAIDHAKDVGADLIVTESDYVGSDDQRYSFSVPTSNTSYVSGSAYTSNGYAGYSGTVTTYGSTQVSGSYKVGRFRQKAVFLKMADGGVE